MAAAPTSTKAASTAIATTAAPPPPPLILASSPATFPPSTCGSVTWLTKVTGNLTPRKDILEKDPQIGRSRAP
jgi:hypothetical protein